MIPGVCDCKGMLGGAGIVARMFADGCPTLMRLNPSVTEPSEGHRINGVGRLYAESEFGPESGIPSPFAFLFASSFGSGEPNDRFKPRFSRLLLIAR